LQSIRFRNREYMNDLYQSSPSVPQTTRLDINPGLTSFPWLSTIANSFEKYRWHSLSFMYEPACSTSVGGTVLLAPDYDAADRDDNLTKGELMAFGDSVRTAPWQRAQFTCTRKNMVPQPRYTRDKLIPGTDIKTYDVLSLYLHHSASSAGTLGELWVEYDVELITPQVDREPGTTEYITNPATGPAATPFAGAEIIPVNEFSMVKSSDTALEFQTPKPGEFLGTIECNGTGLGVLADPTLSNPLAGDSIVMRAKGTNATSTTGIVQFLLNLASGDRVNPLLFNFAGPAAGTLTDTVVSFAEVAAQYI
jgi:hypothetical protein